MAIDYNLNGSRSFIMYYLQYFFHSVNLSECFGMLVSRLEHRCTVQIVHWNNRCQEPWGGHIFGKVAAVFPSDADLTVTKDTRKLVMLKLMGLH